MPITVSHVDTCLACYLTDHCNGDNESLIGVAVSNAMTVAEVKAELLNEVGNVDDKIPTEYGATEIAAAVGELFDGANPAHIFDPSGENPEEMDSEGVYAWFRFDWD